MYTNGTRYELVVALRVTDEAGYQRYRDGMTPILEEHGGYFRHDFRVAEVLRGERDDVNRVFILSFPDADARTAFFANARYLKVRRELFEPSVEGGSSILAEYEAVPPTPGPR